MHVPRLSRARVVSLDRDRAGSLHTGWDVVHHFLRRCPILSFQPTSSAGCAITDLLIALWFFAGAPSLGGLRAKLARA